jgi:hypothetical protein
MEVTGQFHDPAGLTSGKEPPVPGKLGGPLDKYSDTLFSLLFLLTTFDTSNHEWAII